MTKQELITYITNLDIKDVKGGHTPTDKKKKKKFSWVLYTRKIRNKSHFRNFVNKNLIN